MKRILALGLALLAATAVSLQAAADRVIQYTQLPKTAQAFITKHFPGRTASLVKEDRERTGVSYEVRLSDGTEIEFTAQGQWKDVDGKRAALPTAFIPAQIVKTLRNRNAGDAIVQIEKSRRGYKVELASGVEAHFNNQLQFVRYDD